MPSSLPTPPPKEDAGISPRAPQHNEQPANSLPQNSNHGAVTGQSNPEQALLTEKNLKKLNKPQPTKHLSTASYSTISTYLGAEQEEYYTNLIRQQYGSPVPYKQTPSPSPPPDAAIARGPEKPRSAKTIQTTHEPHQCVLGIKCTLEIEDRNYHRIMATHLVTRARLLHLPVRALNPDRDYDDLASLRSRSEYAAKKLLEEHQRIPIWGFRGPHPMEVLKKIELPEYWEAERRYLESPGCLAERQKASASTLSAEVLPDTSSIDVDNHESPHQESAAEGCLECTQQEEVMADGVSMVEQCPLQVPPRGTRSRTQLSTSLASPAHPDSRVHPDNEKEPPASHPRLMGMNKSAASPNISDWTQEQGHVRLGKRKLIEDAAVSDDVAPKRRKANNTASPPAPRSPTFAASPERRETAASHFSSSTYQPIPKRPTRRSRRQPLGPAEPSRVSKVKSKPQGRRQTNATCKLATTKCPSAGVCNEPRQRCPPTTPVPRRSPRVAEIQNAKPAAKRERKTATSSTNSANGRSRTKRRNTSIAGGRHGTTIERKPKH